MPTSPNSQLPTPNLTRGLPIKAFSGIVHISIMENKSTISFVFNANLPFVRVNEPRFAFEELPYFETISLNFIPLLKMIDRLEKKSVPYRLALSVSPLLCGLLRDELLIRRYLKYVDNQIAFGEKEIQRLKTKTKMRHLAETYRNSLIEDKSFFTETLRCDIIARLSALARRGKIELLNTSAVEAVLPFFINYPSAISAFIETSLITYRKTFKKRAQGFWLPEMAYCKNLDEILTLYNFGWTIIDTHSALLSKPSPKFGSFYPAKTSKGLILLVRDFYASNDIMGAQSLADDSVFRSYFDDVVYELPLKDVSNFISADGIRISTGYRYYTKGKELYNPALASERAREKSKLFLEKRLNTLAQVDALINGTALTVVDKSPQKPPVEMGAVEMGAVEISAGSIGSAQSAASVKGAGRKQPISLCNVPIDFIGRFWQEGYTFLEEVFTQASKLESVQISTPSEYIYHENTEAFQTIAPELSSSGANGYLESFLDSSNDWIYKYLLRSIERMINLSERTGRSSDLWDRVLNQSARELFLASSSALARLLSTSAQAVPYDWKKFSEGSIKKHLKNFTSFYESLGGAYVSTRFLIELEQEHNVFPDLNYHSFQRKPLKASFVNEVSNV